ncbi:hypothetical protein [Nocardioides sp. Leaf285]|uniref:hypothetical protein n=1 Tax=Nocardioides sp. Leaf285 TaxID=1736322 RepID=UPI0007031147|nr:hypothetical protein [Nocardioides sp. Leaf285]KQP62846.1 hypothetical protein ASF47_17695 [Nocardioides sp. Leaf285]
MSLSAAPVTGAIGVRFEDRGFLQVPLEHLLDVCHPGHGDPWGVGPLSLDDLRSGEALCTHRPDDPTGSDRSSADASGPCRSCEIRRVRFLALTGWPDLADDPHPVCIDVGVGDFVPAWPILDGNHRVLAAWLRDDASIGVEIAGDWDRAVALLIDGDLTAWDD